MAIDIEARVAEIAAKAGWTDETVHEVAYGFLVNAVSDEVARMFVGYLSDVWETERTAGQDGDA